MSREIPPLQREYKADMIICRDAYWNDAGIFSIMRTRRFFHKGCFETAIGDYKRWLKDSIAIKKIS